MGGLAIQSGRGYGGRAWLHTNCQQWGSNTGEEALARPTWDFKRIPMELISEDLSWNSNVNTWNIGGIYMVHQIRIRLLLYPLSQLWVRGGIGSISGCYSTSMSTSLTNSLSTSLSASLSTSLSTSTITARQKVEVNRSRLRPPGGGKSAICCSPAGEKQSSLCTIVYNPCNVRHRLFTNLQLDTSTFVQEHSIVLPQGNKVHCKLFVQSEPWGTESSFQLNCFFIMVYFVHRIVQNTHNTT